MPAESPQGAPVREITREEWNAMPSPHAAMAHLRDLVAVRPGAPVRPPLEEIRRDVLNPEYLLWLDASEASLLVTSLTDYGLHLEAERERDAKRIAALTEALEKAPECAEVAGADYMAGHLDAAVTPQGMAYQIEKSLRALVKEATDGVQSEAAQLRRLLTGAAHLVIHNRDPLANVSEEEADFIWWLAETHPAPNQSPQDEIQRRADALWARLMSERIVATYGTPEATNG